MTVTQEHDSTPEKRTFSGKLWTAIGLVLAAAAVASPYFIIRFVSSPIEKAIVVVGVLLIALAVVGYLAAGRGRAAGFIAIALVLPYLVAGAAALASVERVADEVGNVFDDTSITPEEKGSDLPDEREDGNEDGVPDNQYADVDCETLPADGEDAGLEYELCLDNGGYQGGE